MTEAENNDWVEIDGVRVAYRIEGKLERLEYVAQAIAFLLHDDFISEKTLICNGGLRFSA